MGIKLRRIIIISLIFLQLFGGIAAAAANDPLDSAKLLLQKNLTVYEIDQELSRLTVQEQQITQTIQQNEQNIAAQQQTTELLLKRAGSVLRAYYMGDRLSLLAVLFQNRPFTETSLILEYLGEILSNDWKILTQYRDANTQLTAMNKTLTANLQELQSIKSKFIAQRTSTVKLQSEIDAQLAANPQKDQIEKQMNQLIDQWKNNGLPMFHRYFDALAKAMKNLPQYITSKSNGLTLDGLNLILQMTDQQLNEFLRSQNAIFQNMTFQFTEDGRLTAVGTDNGTEIKLSGTYLVDQKPKNMIRFHILEMFYNGYQLPDSTVQDLEQSMDLNIDPQKYSLSIKKLKIEKGKMTLTLQLLF